MPSPPEYCGSAAVIPYSGEKYAIAAGPSDVWPDSWYQRRPVRYSSSSATASPSLRRKSSSAARAASRSWDTRASSPAGSCPEFSHATGSISANSALVGACQDQRKLSIRVRSGASVAGSAGWMVNRRIALTLSDPNAC